MGLDENESGHLRELVQKQNEEIAGLKYRLRRIDMAVEYLTFVSEQDTLTATEKALVEMVQNYLRD